MLMLSLYRGTLRLLCVMISIVVVVLIGCEPSERKPTESQALNLTGSPVTATDCKLVEYHKSPDTAHDAFNCLEFAYDGDSVLSLTHVNALFNCCPDSFAIDVSFEDGIITITEKEFLADLGCDCVCLYDLDYEISGVEPGRYTIRVIEPYRSPSEASPELQFSLDLVATPAGSFCVDTLGSPWNGTPAPEATVIEHGECIAGIEETGIHPVVALECVRYAYADDALTIEHLGALFNCCADSSSVAVGLIDRTLIIQEREYFVDAVPCRCLCPIDFSYKISELPAGEYTILLLGAGETPYAAKIIFSVDLVTQPDGEYCSET